MVHRSSQMDIFVVQFKHVCNAPSFRLDGVASERKFLNGFIFRKLPLPHQKTLDVTRLSKEEKKQITSRSRSNVSVTTVYGAGKLRCRVMAWTLSSNIEGKKIYEKNLLARKLSPLLVIVAYRKWPHLPGPLPEPDLSTLPIAFLYFIFFLKKSLS